MATTKLTITLDNEHLAAIRELVRAGKATTVSGFVRHAVGVSLADIAGWNELLGLALDASGGPLTHKERSWADGVLRGRAGRRGRRAATRAA
jgi:hypothetical protein